MAATFNIVVKVDANAAVVGTQRVNQALDRTKSKAMEVNRAIRNLFGFFVVKEAVMGLYRLADGYTVLQNRLRTVSKDQANLNGLTEATFKIAQETRSSWAATAELYARVARNSKEVGASQSELLTVTRALNHAMIVGGATSMEASAGLVQLSQGLASGTLRGDELRAVLEQLPVVADTIAKHMKVTRGELRQLGKDGKIGAREVIDAFLKAAPDLEKQFGKTVPTIAQSFEMLRNAAEKFFGEAGTGSGVLAGIARIIMFVSENFETFGKVLIAVGQAILGLMIIKSVIKLIQMLAIAVAANPLTALLMALTTGVLLLRQFGDQISVAEGSIVKVSDVLKVLWEDFKKVIDIIYEFLKFAWAELTTAFDTGIPTDGIELSLRNVLVFIAGFVGTAVGLFGQVKEKGLEIFGGFAVAVGEVFIDIGRAIARFFGDIINAIIDGINLVERHMPGGSVRQQGRRDDILAETRGKLLQALMAGRKPEEFGLQPFSNIVMHQGRTGPLNDMPSRQQTPQEFVDSFTMSHLSTDQLNALRKRLGLGAGSTDAVGKVDFDFNNPLAGAATTTRNLITSAIEETKNTATEFMDGMNSWVDSVMDRASANAAERLKNQQKSTIGTDKGQTIPPPPTEAEKKAWEALLRKLDALLKKSNEVREAEMKLAEAEMLLDKFMSTAKGQKALADRGVTAAEVLSDYRKELAAALDPMGHWIDKQLEAMAAMKGSREEAEHAARVQEIVNDLTEKGLTLKQHELNQIERITTMQEKRARVWKIEQDILDQIQEPSRKYLETLEALVNLTLKARISHELLSESFRKATAEYLKSKDAEYEEFLARKAEEDPIGAGALKAKDELEAMFNIADATSDAIMSVASTLEEFLVGSATSGELAWEDAIGGIEQALARLSAKIIEQWLLMQALNLLAPGSGGVLAPGRYVTGGEAITDDSDLSFVTGGGYATGGTYMVGGVGGPDSQRVLFNLTPGERVDFTPPGTFPDSATPVPTPDFSGVIRQMTDGIVEAVRAGVGSSQSQAGQRVTVNNKWDDQEVLDVVGSSEGERVILNVVRKNPHVVRALVRR